MSAKHTMLKRSNSWKAASVSDRALMLIGAFFAALFSYVAGFMLAALFTAFVTASGAQVSIGVVRLLASFVFAAVITFVSDNIGRRAFTLSSQQRWTWVIGTFIAAWLIPITGLTLPIISQTPVVLAALAAGVLQMTITRPTWFMRVGWVIVTMLGWFAAAWLIVVL